MHSINATRESNENDRFSAQLRRAKLMSGRYIENVAFLGLKCRYLIFSAKFTHAYIHTYIHTHIHTNMIYLITQVTNESGETTVLM